MMKMQQTPSPGSRGLYWNGDSLVVTLRLVSPAKGTAAVRTNLGGAVAERREIIDETEKGETPLARAWRDYPMNETEPGVWSCAIPLREVGVFSFKAYFRPEGREISWPEGDNAIVKVEPAHTRTNNSIYTVFTRQFGSSMSRDIRTDDVKGAERFLDEKGYSTIPPSGTFRNVIRNLNVIMDEMRFKIIQLLPIFPTPYTYARMGRYGCPFAATDFLSVDPSCAEFDVKASPLDQFRELVDAVHARKGYIYVDLPANHTGWASTLQTHHPEWYRREVDGSFKSPGAWGVVWADLVELDYSNPELRAYMAEVFLFWCRNGVDGFRCDAGYMIPAATWRYIVARVREEYPDTVFMLEGLGGKLSVTDELLTSSNLDWAYSEVFQTYNRDQFEWYLPNAIRRAETMGSLVHFAETHDNDRLAKGGREYARLRVMISALLSHQGAWGMANGVEWYCVDKIDVHGASSLNWGSPDNMIPLIARLNTLLSNHPAFGAHTRLSLVTRGGGNTLAVLREWDGGKVLILANLDCHNPVNVDWNRSRFAYSKCFDLVSDKPRDVSGCVGLGPAEVLCLAGETVRSVAKATVVFRDEDSMPAVEWQWPQDARREVSVPKGMVLRIKSPAAFRVDVKDGDRTVATARVDEGPSCSATLKLPEYGGDGTSADRYRLSLVVFQPEGIRRSESDVLVLPSGSEARAKVAYSGEEIRKADELKTVLSNGAGADAQINLKWGEIRSQYDSLLSANPDPEVPADRVVLWSRCRIWLQCEGFSREVNKDCLSSFRADPAGKSATWFFRVPCGMGRQVSFAIRHELAPGVNAARLTMHRYSSGAGEASGTVRLVLRPDVEWRSYHATTKAKGDVETAFAHGIVGHDSHGFTFSPWSKDEKLIFSVTNGEYHDEPEWTYNVAHCEEIERGQEPSGDLYSPGWISCDFALDEGASVVAVWSTPKNPVPSTIAFPKALDSFGIVELETAPATVPVPDVLLRGMELFVQRRNDLKTVLAGYPWFLDWGRDTLIFLRGAIAAGRYEESLAILTAFARFEENGTIPNIIYGTEAGNRDTSDAPLWLIVSAADLVAKKGRKILSVDCTPLSGGRKRTLADVLESIVRNYVEGTPNGIKVDPDSLLVWSPSHFTWMDTNYPAGTPRIGYPVEIQALWIAGLKFLAKYVDGKYAAMAAKAKASLERYFKVPGKGLADCLRARNGEAAAIAEREDVIRPNQLFALALGVLEEGEALAAEIVSAASCLLVPGGVRSVADAPSLCDMSIWDGGRELVKAHAPYHGRYTGDENTSRKPAYHNGTVWAWPFPMVAEGLMKTGLVSRETALSLLASSVENLNAGCVCHISENADGDAPHAQKGCRAQAWSLSELLRVWIVLAAAEPAGVSVKTRRKKR